MTETPVADAALEIDPTDILDTTAADAGIDGTDDDGEQAADASATPARPSVKEYLASLTPEERREALSTDWVAGHVGDLANRQARKIISDGSAAQRAERLETLRRVDPIAYADEMGKIGDEHKAKLAEMQQQNEWAGHTTTALVEVFKEKLPPEVLDQFRGKSWDGEYHQGVASAVADMIDAAKAQWEIQFRAKYEKEDRPALRKQILAELNGTEPTPEPSRGTERRTRPGNLAEAEAWFLEGRITATEFKKYRYAA